MKINFDKQLMTLNGKPIIEEITDGEPKSNGQFSPKPKTVLLKTVSVNALMSNVSTDSGEEKLKKFNLAMKIHSDKEVDLKAEEIALIKDLIGKFFGPLIVGRAYELLDK